MSTRIRKALLGALMAVATFVATMVVATPAQAVQYYLIQNRYSDKCLAIGGGSYANGAHAVQWTCSTNEDQRWISYSYQQYRNLNSGLCLAIGDSDTSNGAHAIQWTCSQIGSFEQQWVFIPV